MDEVKKVNNKENKFNKVKKSNNNIEIKELRLGKMSPGFNLVCLKARHRLNELEKKFTKSEYKDYIRKCKNMYSVSSDMNNKYTISDLYNREKYDIDNIFSVFYKIDSKLDSQKIKVKKLKKKKILNFVNDKTLSYTNFYRNKSNTNMIKNNTFYNYTKNKFRNTKEEFKNNNIKINSISYEINNSINNKINKIASYELNSINNKKRNNKNKKIYVKNQISLKSKIFSENLNKNRAISNTLFSSFGNKPNKNVNENININKKNRLNSTDLIHRIHPKQFPLSCKNNGNDFIITQHGGIIFKNSMFRNKNIIYLLPKYYNLPLLYKNAKI